MGLRLLDQDLALDRQESRQRLDAEADAAVALTDRALSQTAVSMLTPNWRPSAPGAILVRATPDSLITHPPNALLFAPVAPSSPAPDPSLFAAAERDEFARNDPQKAAITYKQLLNKADPNIQAAALVRLARVQVKANDTKAALATYERLASSNAVFDGTPVYLLARLARANLLAGKTEAVKLGQLLDQPRLPISRDVFLFHANRAQALSNGGWQPDPARLALAEAVHSVWPGNDGAGRIFLPGPSLTILHHRSAGTVTVLTANLDFAKNQWAAKSYVQLNGTDGVARLPAASGLPWPISLPNPQQHSLFSGHRRLLALGTFAIPLMLLLTGYLSWRALSRERATSAMQADFVAAVSHEFRTPLTALRQFTGMLLERETLTNTQLRTCYEAQARSTERLSRLVESLLDFRRMEAGARPYNLEPLDASRFLVKLAAEFQQESGAEIQLDIPTECPIHADPGALSLALWNLLDNAVKYAESPIELQLQSTPTNVTIRVTDHGPGIPPSEQPRVFDKFYRGAGARKNGVKGTGIGLAMVQHVAQAHRGRVELHSQPGQGTAFSLVLPNHAQNPAH